MKIDLTGSKTEYYVTCQLQGDFGPYPSWIDACEAAKYMRADSTYSTAKVYKVYV